jgi:hypothetical protein
MSSGCLKYLKLKNSDKIVNRNHYSVDGVLMGADFRVFEKNITGRLLFESAAILLGCRLEEQAYERLLKEGVSGVPLWTWSALIE